MSMMATIRELLGLDPASTTSKRRDFRHRQVSPLADYDLVFEGWYEHAVSAGDGRRSEHRFDVYLGEDHRVEGKPIATVTERVFEGDSEDPVTESTEELVVDIDPDLEGNRLRTAIEKFLRGWHRSQDPEYAEGSR